jgi:hypothetical protein
MLTLVQQLIDIFWSDITNKEVINQTHAFLVQKEVIPEPLTRFMDMMNDFLVPGNEKSAFYIVEPYGETLHKLEPVYYAK